MAVTTVNKDGSITTSIEDELSDEPTGAVVVDEGPITTHFLGDAKAEAKVVETAASQSKTVKKSRSK